MKKPVVKEVILFSLNSEFFCLIIESYLLEKYSVKIDFEVSDGINKLKQMNLLMSLATDDSEISATPLEVAQTILKEHWKQLI